MVSNSKTSIEKIIVAMAVLAGLGLAIYGLSQQVWPSWGEWGDALRGENVFLGGTVLPWDQYKDLFRFVGLLVVLISIFVFLEAKLKLRAVPGFLLVATLFALFTGQVLALIMLGVFILSALVLGEGVLKTIKAGDYARDGVSPFLVGAGIYGTTVGLLAHLPVNYPAVYGLLVLLPLLLFWRRATIPRLVAFADYFKGKNTQTMRENFLGALLSAIAMLHLVYALLPELGYDALAVHLQVPATLYHQGKWAFDPLLYVFSVMPMQADWIFSIGYMFAGETGARLFNLAFSYLMAMQGYRLTCWLGGSPTQAKFTALLFLTTPLTFTETSSLHVEAVWSAYIVAGTMAVMRLVSEKDSDTDAHLKSGGLLFGFALSVKVITLTMLPALMLLMLLRIRSWCNRRAIRAASIGLALFSLFGAIPYLTAWIIAKNPVFPFFNAVFESPYFPLWNFSNPLFNSGMTWDLPYRMIFDAERYLEATVGAPGFQWLVLLPAAILALLLRKNRRALALTFVAALSMLIVFRSQSYLRYIFPLFLYSAALISVGFGSMLSMQGVTRFVSSLALAVTAILNLVFFSSANWNYRSLPLETLINEDYRNHYLAKRAPVRVAVQVVNQLNQSRTPVLFLAPPAAAGLNADAVLPSWYNATVLIDIHQMRTIADLVDVLVDANVTYIILDDHWNIPNYERRLFGESVYSTPFDDWSNADTRALVTGATVELFRFESVSVRALLDEYRFATELLMNTDLNDLEGWSVFDGTTINDGVAAVSRDAPIAQAVPVSGGRLYRNQVLARCDQKATSGRVQVNWLDAEGTILDTSITTFECTDTWQYYTQKIRAPEKATQGVVFGNSHSADTIQVSEVSLR